MIYLWMTLMIACTPPNSPPAPPASAYHVASSDDLAGPFTNRLAQESSPYLLQHAHNPVNWYPWGEEAFAEAKRRDLPIFLSIGYAACHWCHVMEHESFEDPAVAAYLNEHFVSIKVDREERPDVDGVYMEAVHLLNQHGGWPANLWLTTDLKPFHAGTYFPPNSSHGRPSFRSVLEQLSSAWTNRRPQVLETADQVQDGLVRQAIVVPTEPMPHAQTVKRGAKQMIERSDPVWGGWGERKFPMATRVEFLLAYGLQHDDSAALKTVTLMLDRMDAGGIHDHIGGGFHRYTVDAHWTIPHFEKMLYDQGQLLRLYAQASGALNHPRYAEVAHGIASYLLRDLQDPSGAFWSSEDADTSEGEGTYYAWTEAQVRAALPASEADAFLAAYPCTARGNFEHGLTVLNRASDSPSEPLLIAAREALLAVRSKRLHPPVDTKRVVSYNALAISGLAIAGRLLSTPRYIEAAQKAADALLAARRDDHTMPRTLEPNSPAGVSDDYAFFIEALLDLYEADPDPKWLIAADSLNATLYKRFLDPEDGALFHSIDPSLLVRRKDFSDGAEPSAIGRSALSLKRLIAYGAPSANTEMSDRLLLAAGSSLNAYPTGLPSFLQVVDGDERAHMQVMVATQNTLDSGPFAAHFNQRWRPNTTFASFTATQRATLSAFSAFDGKVPGQSGPLSYVCFDGVCNRPTGDLSEYLRLISNSD